MKKNSFRELERFCEEAFRSRQEWWHLYTPGRETPLIFIEDDDFRYSINLLSRCLFEINSIILIAFEIMNNHIHLVLSGNNMEVRDLFELFKRRLSRYYVSKRRQIPKEFQANIKQILDLKTMRNNIVYVNRNGYVVNSNYTPFSYPWGTGRYYFNEIPLSSQLKDFKDLELREMFRSRTLQLPSDYKVINGHIAPPSFCDIELGMSMFRNAHHYFADLSKNVEAYSEMAIDMDDGEFLTDAELFTQVWKIAKERYGVNSLKELKKSQKHDLARTLHYDFRSSNGQIRRVLNISQYEIDAMFPLTAK